MCANKGPCGRNEGAELLVELKISAFYLLLFPATAHFVCDDDEERNYCYAAVKHTKTDLIIIIIIIIKQRELRNDWEGSRAALLGFCC